MEDGVGGRGQEEERVRDMGEGCRMLKEGLPIIPKKSCLLQAPASLLRVG